LGLGGGGGGGGGGGWGSAPHPPTPNPPTPNPQSPYFILIYNQKKLLIYIIKIIILLKWDVVLN